jgi:hypothetical protein
LLFYGLLYRRRGDIQSLGLALQLESERTGIVTIASDLSQPTNQQQRSRSTGNLQRRPSIMGKTESLTYLVQLFETFLPSRYYTGVWLLLLRLAQTSLMTVFDSQLAQAAVMGCVTLGAAAALRELSPYRRPSDNHSALLGQWLVFAWVFVMLLRLAGLFQSGFAALAIGVLLCALTLAVFVTAVVMANNDRNAEAHAGDVAANAQHSDGDADAASSDAAKTHGWRKRAMHSAKAVCSKLLGARSRLSRGAHRHMTRVRLRHTRKARTHHRLSLAKAGLRRGWRASLAVTCAWRTRSRRHFSQR